MRFAQRERERDRDKEGGRERERGQEERAHFRGAKEIQTGD